jgi:hypothetical protein
VQTALNELDTDKAPLASPTFTGTVGGITGAMIANTPAGGIAATTVQTALNELDTEKAATDQTMYIGTTQVAINRASAALVLTGITSIDGNAATATTISGTASNKLPDIDVTQATGALTVACNAAIYQDFRSTTLTDGTPTTVLCDPADLVIPDGATLGSTTTVAADIAVLMINNAGTAELAVKNITGTGDLAERGVISTTAIGTGSDSADVFYSTTARTNVAYKVVKLFRAVNTAGTWGGPSLVEGGGLSNVAVALHAYGSAPMYACRAWAIFNGTTAGTNAPLAGGNITSITRNAAGLYTANIASAMPDTLYSIAGCASNINLADGSRVICLIQGSKTTTTFQFTVVYAGAPTTGQDNTEISIQVFR